jgi:hypothetical protein
MTGVIPSEIVRRVSLATCAIGWLQGTVEEYASDPLRPRFRIVGTGFLVREDTILTARHVISTSVQDRDNRGRADHPLVAGFYIPGPSSVDLRIHAWGFAGWLNPPLEDIGVIRIDEPDERARQMLRPLGVSSNFTTAVSSPVSVTGFAFGAGAMVRQESEARLYRVGPVLQQGYVSAIAPFGESDRVDRLLLDIRTTSGMSGAAVVDSRSGEVIGVHTGGYGSEPSVLAFAAPLNDAVVVAIVDRLSGFSVGDSPASGEIEIHVPIVRRQPPAGA